MKIPRNITGRELAGLLFPFGYEVTRQVGSHIRLTTNQKGKHHITIPDHKALRIGTLSSIINEVALHFNMSKSELLQKLFG